MIGTRERYPEQDVTASRADARLQRLHADEVREIRAEAEASTHCPACGAPGPELAWFYFESPSWTWDRLCGRAGVIAAAPVPGYKPSTGQVLERVPFYGHWVPRLRTSCHHGEGRPSAALSSST